MLLDMINIEKLRRTILYLLVLIAVFFLQEIILSHVVILGVRPLIIPIAVAAIGFWNGGVWGGVFGILAGIFADMSLNTSSVLMTVLFPFIGFFSGALPMFFMSRSLGSFFFLSAAALVITALLQMLEYLLFSGTQITVLLLTGLLQTLWSLPFIFLIFFPCRRISGLKLNR